MEKTCTKSDHKATPKCIKRYQKTNTQIDESKCDYEISHDLSRRDLSIPQLCSLIEPSPNEMIRDETRKPTEGVSPYARERSEKKTGDAHQ